MHRESNFLHEHSLPCPNLCFPCCRSGLWLIRLRSTLIVSRRRPMWVPLRSPARCAVNHHVASIVVTTATWVIGPDRVVWGNRLCRSAGSGVRPQTARAMSSLNARPTLWNRRLDVPADLPRRNAPSRCARAGMLVPGWPRAVRCRSAGGTWRRLSSDRRLCPAAWRRLPSAPDRQSVVRAEGRPPLGALGD